MDLHLLMKNLKSLINRHQAIGYGVLSVAFLVFAIITSEHTDESVVLPFLLGLLVVASLVCAVSCIFAYYRIQKIPQAIDDDNVLNDLERGESSSINYLSTLQREPIRGMESLRKITQLQIIKAILQEIKYEVSDENMFTFCVICLEDFEEGKLCSLFPTCKHQAFHKDCLIAWFKKGQFNCPICRCKF
ncbi:hypothetical protein ACFE04_031494 [Oxalis oulophora]